MKNRDKIAGIKKDYTKIPNQLYRLNLSAQIVGLVCFLLSLPESFNPSVKFLARKFHKDPKTIRKWLHIVENHGIIKAYKKGSFKYKSITLYEFRPKLEWK